MRQPSNSILFWMGNEALTADLFRVCCRPKTGAENYETYLLGMLRSIEHGTPESTRRLTALFKEECESVTVDDELQEGAGKVWTFTDPTISLSIMKGLHSGVLLMISNWESITTVVKCLGAVAKDVPMVSFRNGSGTAKDKSTTALLEELQPKKRKAKTREKATAA